jgi:hypothetical protein
LENADGITVGKSSRQIFGGEHQVSDGVFVIAPFFEVQRKLRRQFPSPGSTDPHELLS